MDGPRGDMLSEMSDRERHIPYDFIYMWNLNNNIKKQNRLIDVENRLMVARGEEIGGLAEKGEGTEKYSLAVTK